MGCVLPKPSNKLPPRGLDRMKLESDYLPSSEFAGPTKRPSGRIAAAATPDGEGRKKESGGVGRGGDADEMFGLWPQWLTDNVPREVLAGLVPKGVESYEKIDKIGQGTYSNVYKARDRDTGKIVALKKVRFDTSESESVRFMAREIMILQKLDHPNVIKLEGLATSRMQYSLYLVFEFMQTDLSKIISLPDERLTEPQVKCYMQQLLSGLQHCHERGILHRDIKGSNLLIDKNGMLKIADFGLANYFNPKKKRPLTSRVVTLWYRSPELLLGTTDYGIGIDLWSAGCLFAEMFVGRAILPGRTEVEQLHRIFKLCGSPPEDYWKKLKLQTSFRPPQSYKPSISERFRGFPSSSLGLLTTLLALEPSYRGSAASALRNEFFSTSPLACDLSGLPVSYKGNDGSNQHRDQRRKRLRQRLSGQNVQRETDSIVEVDYGSSNEEKPIDLPRSESVSSPVSNTTPINDERYYGSPHSSTVSPVGTPIHDPPRRSESQPLATRKGRNFLTLGSDYGERLRGQEDVELVEHPHGIEKRTTSRSAFPRFYEQTPIDMSFAD